MDNKQTRIFYLVLLLIIVLLFDVWFFFLKDKWQQKEAAVVDLRPCQVAPAVKPAPTNVVVLEERIVVETPEEVLIEEDVRPAPPEVPFWGNRGYTTKDGKLTYRPVSRVQE